MDAVTIGPTPRDNKEPKSNTNHNSTRARLTHRKGRQFEEKRALFDLLGLE